MTLYCQYHVTNLLLYLGITYEGNYTVLNDDQLENYATDSVIIRCVDDGPSNDRADNYSISSHRQVIGRRRCRPVTTVTSTNTCKWHMHNYYIICDPV